MVDKGRVKSVTALRRLHNEARSRSRALSPPSDEAGGSGWKRVGREPEPARLCLSLSYSLCFALPRKVLVMRVLAHPCVPRLFDVMHSVRFVHLVTEDGGAALFELLARYASCSQS